jgi:transposase
MKNMEDWLMIRQLYKKGVGISQIASMTGFSRMTVRKYAKSDHCPKYKRQKNKPSKLDTYKEHIANKLSEAQYTATRLCREIKEQGYSGSYSVVRRYVRQIRAQCKTKAVYRFETEPGQQAQVDLGEFGRIKENGKEQKLYCFSIILGYSRIRYIEFITSNKTDTLIKCHINSFNYFGGYPNELLYDNLKQVILKRMLDIKDSKLNTQYADFSGYYGFTPRFCRPYRAQTKGKVENTIKYVRNDFFMGIEVTSLNELNSKAMEWLSKINSKVHSTTNEIPFERLKKEKLNSIKDVPPYDTTKVQMRKVSPDCYVHYQGNRYSVPYKYAGYNVEIKVSDNELAIYFGKERICSHELLSGINRVSKDKTHFEGLLKQIRDENNKPYRKNGVLDCDISLHQVEKRSLDIYDVVGGVKDE